MLFGAECVGGKGCLEKERFGVKDMVQKVFGVKDMVRKVFVDVKVVCCKKV